MRALIVPVLLLVALPVFRGDSVDLRRVDTDGDEAVSADEAASVEGLDFDAADADADGTLSVDNTTSPWQNCRQPPNRPSRIMARRRCPQRLQP